MPFDFLRRKPDAAERHVAAADERAAGAVVPFDGLTEEWRLRGRMASQGRLSDALNRRAETPITDVSWAPIDGSQPFQPVPGLKSVDPYDLILVLASADAAAMTEDEKAAHKVHKLPFDVAIEAPPYRVVGTVFLRPGTDPHQLMDRSTEMFVPVVGGVVYAGDDIVPTEGEIESVLVNRFYIRGIEQIDLATGERPVKLPGRPLGGTTWQERAR
ncbi:MAG TPA: hypothetical protein VFC71_03065 [Candidatus Polarisedimenticolia bacterium]|nr:hypothetical protein [Candidatus Polarisedimenticolia bacterium]